MNPGAFSKRSRARFPQAVGVCTDMEAQTNICATCGVQFAPGANEPEHCPICEDERQYVGWSGQRWTALSDLRKAHRNQMRDDLGLLGIGTEPSFAIGQRAILVPTPEGNLLWDCITLLDDATVEAVQKLGGLRAIAISHPHYYSAMVEWGRAFDAPVYLHAADRQWVMRESPRINFWQGTTFPLWDDLTLINCGGHFKGGTVLHWPAGSNGNGALLTSDILTVVQDRRYLSFMRSYPNLIPLGPAAIDRILETLEEFSFGQIYGGWWKANVLAHAKAAVARSAERYLRAIGDPRGR